MLKKSTALILLLAFIAMVFSPAFVFLDFYANQNYIAKNLCENRDKPMMHCCGKCILKKKLQEEEKRNQEEQRLESFVKLIVPKKFSVKRNDPFLTILIIHPPVS